MNLMNLFVNKRFSLYFDERQNLGLKGRRIGASAQ